jgi:hypothetical protein
VFGLWDGCRDGLREVRWPVLSVALLAMAVIVVPSAIEVVLYALGQESFRLTAAFRSVAVLLYHIGYEIAGVFTFFWNLRATVVRWLSYIFYWVPVEDIKRVTFELYASAFNATTALFVGIGAGVCDWLQPVANATDASQLPLGRRHLVGAALDHDCHVAWSARLERLHGTRWRRRRRRRPRRQRQQRRRRIARQRRQRATGPARVPGPWTNNSVYSGIVIILFHVPMARTKHTVRSQRIATLVFDADGRHYVRYVIVYNGWRLRAVCKALQLEPHQAPQPLQRDGCAWARVYDQRTGDMVRERNTKAERALMALEVVGDDTPLYGAVMLALTAHSDVELESVLADVDRALLPPAAGVKRTLETLS